MEKLRIVALTTEEDAARLDAIRLAARMVDETPPLSIDRVQALYDVILKEYADYQDGIIALGIAFGELIVREAGFEWVRVNDDYGSETSLASRDSQVACYPISIIEKRIARAERVDLARLRDDTIKTVQDLVDSGNYETR